MITAVLADHMSELLASMAMAGRLGHMQVASMLTTSTSMVVTSTRRATSIVGTAFLSAAWLIRVYVTKKPLLA